MTPEQFGPKTFRECTTIVSTAIQNYYVIILTEGNIHIRSWQEFRHVVAEKKPASIVFILEQNGFSKNKELSTLKIIMLHDKRYYIFYDFPKGEALRETRIPLHKDKNGIPNLDEEEVKVFLKGQFEGLDIYSFWTA